MKYRLQLYIQEEAVSLSVLAERLWGVLDGFRATEPRADGWCYETESGVARVTNVRDCGGALESNAYPFRVGATKRIGYEPTIHAGAPDSPLVSVTYSCGIGQLGIPGIFAPSRLVAIVDSGLPGSDPALLQTWMLKAIEILRPRFGHAGSLETPRPLTPLEPGQVPPVGWLTYLSHDLGSNVPAKLPTPSVAYPAPDGTLLVAHPELFQQHKGKHREAVNNLGQALALAPLR